MIKGLKFKLMHRSSSFIVGRMFIIDVTEKISSGSYYGNDEQFSALLEDSFNATEGFGEINNYFLVSGLEFDLNIDCIEDAEKIFNHILN